jgi:hypothetical protein
VPHHHVPSQALEEVKLREMAIIDLQKRISEGESKLKQQQNLYEAVRGERTGLFLSIFSDACMFQLSPHPRWASG